MSMKTLIERHKCTEWIKGRCTECDEHYIDYVEKLHTALREQEARTELHRELIVQQQARIEELEKDLQACEPILKMLKEGKNIYVEGENILTDAAKRFIHDPMQARIEELVDHHAKYATEAQARIHGLEQTIEGLKLDNNEIPAMQARIEELEFRNKFLEARQEARESNIERLDAALDTCNQMILEVAHAQRSGADWYTKGGSGLHQQVSMWIRKASDAIKKARAGE